MVLSPVVFLNSVHISDERFYQLCQNNQYLKVELQNLPAELSGENILPGFSLNLSIY